MFKKGILKNYSNIIWLLAGITGGSLLGLTFGNKIEIIKPIGDIFLNLLFSAVIPLIFFAVSSAVADVKQTARFSRLITVTVVVFIITALIAAVIMLAGIAFFPLHQSTLNTTLSASANPEKPAITDQITSLFTASDFFELLSRKNMMALIIFSLLIGFAVRYTGERGELFKKFLISGNEVMKSLISIIMKMAPIGLGAYFAWILGTLGKDLIKTYAYSLALYYGFALFYYIVLFSLYAFISGKYQGIKLYWLNNIIPSITAIGTCSSVATIPANLEAAGKMGISKDTGNLVIPLGATLHKEGSSIGAIVKIALVFSLFGRNFSGVDTICLALGIALLTSIVEGGIPNGGYIGELFIVTVYGFPPAALSVIMIIATLIDPMATLLNATGDTVSGMLIARITDGKKFLNNGEENVV